MKKINHKTSEEKAHAKYSASGSERWLECPGSILLSEVVPPLPESKYAQEGTIAHACLEFMLKNISKPGVEYLATQKYERVMVAHATEAIAYLMKRKKQLKGSKLFTETKVDASPFTCADQFGTLDVSIVQEFGTLIIADYKYGAGVPVDPDHNSQLIYYALGVAHEYDYNFTDVELIVIQPRAPHKHGPIRSFKMSIEELMAWIPKFKKGVELCEDPFTYLKAGDWCRWCPAEKICHEKKNKNLRSAQDAFADEPLGDDFMFNENETENQVQQPIPEITPAEPKPAKSPSKARGPKPTKKKKGGKTMAKATKKAAKKPAKKAVKKASKKK